MTKLKTPNRKKARKLSTLLTSITLLLTPTLGTIDGQKVSLYMIDGEEETVLDLFNNYFKNSRSISKITPPKPLEPGKSLAFTHKLINPVTLISNSSSPLPFKKNTNLDFLRSEWRYNIEKVGNLLWTESFKFFPGEKETGSDQEAKVKLTEIKYNMSIAGNDSFTQVSGLIVEEFICTNKMPYDYQYSMSSNFGTLQKISFNFFYGYYKICLVLPEYTSEEKENIFEKDLDYIYFGIDQMENEAFQGKTIKKAEFMMVKVDDDFRKKLDDKKFKKELDIRVIFLDFYDELYADLVYYFKGLRYVYYRNFESRVQKFSTSILDFGFGYEIDQVQLKIEKFLKISGTLQESKDKRKKFVYLFFLKKQDLKKKQHFLDSLKTCMDGYGKSVEKLKVNGKNLNQILKAGIRKKYCFTYYIVGSQVEYLNNYRLPGDLSFILEFKVKRGRFFELMVIKWNEKSKKFENFQTKVNFEKRYLVNSRYDCQDYFVSLVSPKGSKNKFHMFAISPLSYNSESLIFDEHKLFFKKTKEAGSDDLIYYSFDSSNNVLFRRGSETLTIYSFSKPKLIIKRNKTVEYYKTEEEKSSAHLCKKPFKYIIIENQNIKSTKTLEVCYAPELKVGSHFTNTNSVSDSELTRKDFPSGYILKQNINDYRMGSFLHLKNSGESKEKITNTTVQHLMEREYEVNFNYWEMDGIYAFKMNGELEEILSIVISLKGANYIYRGSYHPEGKELGKLERDEFTDFRKIEGVLSMENNLAFIQIQDLSYYLELSNKDSKLAPWNGINGVCSKFVKMKHRRIGNLVVCYFDGRFFIKFYDQDSEETVTKEVKIDSSVKGILSKENIKIFQVKTSDELTHHFVLFYWDKGILGDQNHLRGLFVELYGDLHPIILFNNDIQFNFGEKETNQNNPYSDKDILDIKIAGNLIVFTLSKFNVEAFRIFRIKSDYSVSLIRHSELPNNKIQIIRPVQVVLGLSNGEVREENEINTLEKEQNQYFIACLVYVVRGDGSGKGVVKKKEILVLKPNIPTISSMNLIPIPEKAELISFGPLYSESALNKNIQFVLLCKLKQKNENGQDILRLYLTKQIDSVITFKTDFNIKDIVNSTLDKIFNNEKYNEFKDDRKTAIMNPFKQRRFLEHQSKSLNIKKANFAFSISSQIYSKLESQYYRSEAGYNKDFYKTYYFQDEKVIKKEMNFYEWFQTFKPKNPHYSATKTIRYNEMDTDMGKSQKKEEWNYKIFLNVSSTFTKGMESTRYIKMDPHRFVTGNVIDSFGHCNSILERELELVIIPNMTDVDRINKKRCYKPMKDMKVTLFIWCKNQKFDDPNRLNYGCSGIEKMDSKNLKISKTMNLLDENFVNSKVFVTSQYSLNYFRTTEKNCTLINKGNYENKKDLKPSGDYFYDNKTFRIEKNEKTKKTILRVTEIGNTPSETFDKKGIPHWKFKNYTGNFRNFKIDPKFIQIRVDKLKNELIDDYILVAYEINPETGFHLTTLMYRIQILKTKNSEEIRISDSLTRINKVNQNFETFVFHNETDFSIRYIFLSLEWINNYKLSVMLLPITIKKYNEVLFEKTRSATIMQTRKTIFLGNFRSIDRNFAKNPVIITPEQQSLNYYLDPINPGKDKKNTSLVFVISFPRSNDFLIRLPSDFFEKDYKIVQKSKNPHTIIMFEVAPISNPFIGFTPNKDSPNSIIQGDMFYHVRNYDSFSYLFVYKLNFSKFQTIRISEKVNPDFKDVRTYSNIMATEDDSAMPNYQTYIHTNAVIQLKKRASAATVFTNLYGNNSLFENLLVYSDPTGNIITKKFSSKINIMLKTENVASTKIMVWIRGPKTWFTKIVFNIVGRAQKGVGAELIDWAKIIIVVVLSLAAAFKLNSLVKLRKKFTKIRKRRSTIVQLTGLVITFFFNFIRKLYSNNTRRMSMMIMNWWILLSLRKRRMSLMRWKML